MLPSFTSHPGRVHWADEIADISQEGDTTVKWIPAVWRSLFGILALAALVVPAASGPPVQAASRSESAASLKGGALATFKVETERFRVWVTNPQTIAQLQDLRAGKSTASIPNGRILRGPGKAAHNKPWRWHLDPRDIQMAEMTTEVCDGRPSYVNQHLDEFVGTVKRYCPWGAKLVKLHLYPPVPRPAT